jgi:hypothetical protein
VALKWRVDCAALFHPLAWIPRFRFAPRGMTGGARNDGGVDSATSLRSARNDGRVDSATVPHQPTWIPRLRFAPRGMTGGVLGGFRDGASPAYVDSATALRSARNDGGRAE